MLWETATKVGSCFCVLRLSVIVRTDVHRWIVLSSSKVTYTLRHVVDLALLLDTIDGCEEALSKRVNNVIILYLRGRSLHEGS